MKFIITALLLVTIMSGCQTTRTGNPVKATGDFARPNSTSSVAVTTTTSTGKENKACGAAKIERENLTEPL